MLVNDRWARQLVRPDRISRTMINEGKPLPKITSDAECTCFSKMRRTWLELILLQSLTALMLYTAL
jgi:hypothetical protein